MRPLTLLLLLLLAACRAEPTPASLSDFRPPVGTTLFAACVDKNDGKRFRLDGHLVLPKTVEVSDGKLTLWLYEQIADGDGAGAGTPLALVDGKHVRFAVSGQKTKTAGYNTRVTTGTLEGAALLTTVGEAKIGDRLAAVVELHAQRLFQKKDVFGCSLELIELRPALAR